MSPRRLTSFGLALALLGPTVTSTVIIAAEPPLAPVCRTLGRVPDGVAWAPDGRSLAVVTRDRTSSRLDLLAYPSLERLANNETRDLGLDHRGPAITPDGATYWTGFDGHDQGVWAMKPDGTVSRVVHDGPLPFGSLGSLTWTDAGLVAPGSDPPSSFIVDRIVAVDPTAGSLEPTAITPAGSVSIARDGSILLGVDNGSGVGDDWQLVHDGITRAVHFGSDVLTASITPDGQRLLYSSNEPQMPALQSMLPDGSDVRVEIARGTEPGATVGPDGVLVTIRYPSGMDGPSLPAPQDSDTSTPIADICFSRATWAAPDIPLPASAAPMAIEPVQFVDPPDGVARLLEALPQRIEGHEVRYTGEIYDEAGKPILVTDLDYPLLPATLTLALGIDPDRTWADVGAIDTGEERTRYEPEITLVADGITDGPAWVAAARDLLLRSGDGVSAVDVTIDGRDVVRIDGLPGSGSPYDGIFWPSATSYLVPVSGGLFQIATDDVATARSIIHALPSNAAAN